MSGPGGASAAAFVEAVLGVGLLALIIAYLPSLYAAFGRREALVTKLAMRTGLPPVGSVILSRLWRPAGPQTVLTVTWQGWDAAGLALTAVDHDSGPEVGMCLHAGINSLRHIADFHGIPYRRDAYLYAPPAPWSSDKVVAARPRPPVIHVGPGSLGRVYTPHHPPPGGQPPAQS